MMENGFRIPDENKKIAYLVEKGVDTKRLCEIIAKAQEERENGTQESQSRNSWWISHLP